MRCISIINTPIIAPTTLFMLLHINTKSNYFYKPNINGRQRFLIQLTEIFMLPVFFLYLTLSNNSPYALSIIASPQEKKLFEPSHSCPYCKISFTPSSPHDHLLTFTSSSSDKNSLLQSLNKTISTLHTPSLLQQHIRLSLSKIYNINLCPSKYSLFSSIYA